MKQILSFLRVLFCLLLITGCGGVKEEGVIIVTPDKLQSLMLGTSIQVIDVRTLKEYKTGVITGAKNINFFSDTFSKDILRLDKNVPVVVYCKSGGRSAKAAKKFVEVGFSKIYDLKGGISQWKKEGLKMVAKP